MNYSDFVLNLRRYIDSQPSGYSFELSILPFWDNVEHPTTIGRKFHKMFAESFPEIECIDKPNNDNHLWYRKR